MHQLIKQQLKVAIADRWWLGLVVFNILLTIVAIIIIGLSIQPKEVQVITHYSSFGITQFYRGYWYYLWGYAVLPLIILGSHVVLSLKLIELKKRDLALSLLWLTLGILILVLLYARSIIKLAAIG